MSEQTPEAVTTSESTTVEPDGTVEQTVETTEATGEAATEAVSGDE